MVDVPTNFLDRPDLRTDNARIRKQADTTVKRMPKLNILHILNLSVLYSSRASFLRRKEMCFFKFACQLSKTYFEYFENTG